MAKQIPVYLFVGQLESGKTRFIQETMEDPQFDSGDKTLLLVCEEGEEEYQPERFAFGGVHLAVLEDKSELTTANLEGLAKKFGCGRVIIEYNGMWMIQELVDVLPENWVIYQCLATADGSTIKTYAGDNAMRALLLDKLRVSELLVVNRAEQVNDDESRQLIHKLVRQASRRCDIAYEFKDGSVAYDDIPDPLPFDVNAPVIEIPAEFFGVWYMDCMDEMEKYDGKTVRFLAQVCQTARAGKNCFVPGRFAMTCCVQDIQFVGFPCKYDRCKELQQRDWITLTAKVNIKYHPIYKGQTQNSAGPVLTALAVEPAEKPVEDVVMFS
ncbi:MAG: outer membrane insertion C- signal [Gemmiger sp.]